MSSITGEVLNPGEASAEVLVLDEPLSFWGAFDPRTGEILDQHHPQCGKIVTGKILVLPATRGSGGTPGGIAEAIRRETAPAGIILGQPDINLAIGGFIAARLYGRNCPVIAVGPPDYAKLAKASRIRIQSDGTMTTCEPVP